MQAGVCAPRSRGDSVPCLARSMKPVALATSLLSLGAAGHAAAPDSRAWAVEDTLWELGYLLPLAVDASQSRGIAGSSKVETNPLLPRNPSARTINTACLASGAAHVALAYCLPLRTRRKFQKFTMAYEVTVIARNQWVMGLKANF